MEDYDIPFNNMSDEDFLYRTMNEEDPMYMGHIEGTEDTGTQSSERQ